MIFAPFYRERIFQKLLTETPKTVWTLHGKNAKQNQHIRRF